MSNIKNIALPDGKIYGIREDLVPDYSFNTIQEMNEAINDGDVENDATIYVKERTAYPIPSYTSGDTDLAPTSSVNVPLMTSNESQESLWTKVSNMFKNIRYLIKMLGTTDISSIGDGTVTGAIDEVNEQITFRHYQIQGSTTITEAAIFNSLVNNIRNELGNGTYIIRVGAYTGSIWTASILGYIAITETEYFLNASGISARGFNGCYFTNNSALVCADGTNVVNIANVFAPTTSFLAIDVLLKTTS